MWWAVWFGAVLVVQSRALHPRVLEETIEFQCVDSEASCLDLGGALVSPGKCKPRCETDEQCCSSDSSLDEWYDMVTMPREEVTVKKFGWFGPQKTLSTGLVGPPYLHRIRNEGLSNPGCQTTATQLFLMLAALSPDDTRLFGGAMLDFSRVYNSFKKGNTAPSGLATYRAILDRDNGNRLRLDDTIFQEALVPTVHLVMFGLHKESGPQTHWQTVVEFRLPEEGDEEGDESLMSVYQSYGSRELTYTLEEFLTAAQQCYLGAKSCKSYKQQFGPYFVRAAEKYGAKEFRTLSDLKKRTPTISEYNNIFHTFLTNGEGRVSERGSYPSTTEKTFAALTGFHFSKLGDPLAVLQPGSGKWPTIKVLSRPIQHTWLHARS